MQYVERERERLLGANAMHACQHLGLIFSISVGTLPAGQDGDLHAWPGLGQDQHAMQTNLRCFGIQRFIFF